MENDVSGKQMSVTEANKMGGANLEIVFSCNLLRHLLEMKDALPVTMAAAQNSGEGISSPLPSYDSDANERQSDTESKSQASLYSSNKDALQVHVKQEPSEAGFQDTFHMMTRRKTQSKPTRKSVEIKPIKRKRGRPRKHPPMPKMKATEDMQEVCDEVFDSDVIPDVNAGSVLVEVCEEESAEISENVKEEILMEDIQMTAHHVMESERKKRRYKIKPVKDRDIYHVSRIPCPSSGCRVTKNVPLLRSHIETDHNDDENVNEIWLRYDEAVHNVMQYAGEPVSCPICNCSRNGLRGIKAHVKNCHKDVELSEHQVEVVKKEAKQKQRLRERVSFGTEKCSFCDELFHSRERLWAHRKFKCTKNPNTIKRVHCGKCGIKFLKPENLERHLALHKHTRYVCELCGSSFSGRGGLSSHMRGFHQVARANPIKWYVCEVCEKKFYSKSRYTRHVAMHSDDRNMQCEHCGKCFKTKNCVRKHVNSMHKNQYAYRCEKCGHGMDRLIYLKNHKCGRVRRPQYVTEETNLQGSDNSNIQESASNEFIPAFNPSGHMVSSHDDHLHSIAMATISNQYTEMTPVAMHESLCVISEEQQVAVAAEAMSTISGIHVQSAQNLLNNL